MVICPDCFGDGIETCHNPDHGFVGYGGFLNAVKSANESACPCCGHDENHKMKGKCYTCDGGGVVSKDQYDSFVNENVPAEVLKDVAEICLQYFK